MRVALFVVLLCAVADLLACAVLLLFVWLEHRKVRRQAAAEGQPLPSAAGQFGCLIAFGTIGLALVYGSAWLLLNE